MRKTGKTSFLSFLFLLAALGFYSSTFAQASFSVEATVSENTIFTGERLQLNVTISGDFSEVQRPNLPDFPGFELLSKTPSTSRNVSYSNGVTRSSYTYSYTLVAQDKGKYKIPAIPIGVDGEQFKTDPIDVTITDRNEAATDETADNQPDIYLRLNISDTRPVLGQQLLAKVVLYFKEGLEVSSYQPIPGWKAEGFWKEELENGERPQVQSTIINGLRYRAAPLLQFALFPTKTGKLTISPYEIRVSVRSASQRGDPFSSFFGGFGTNQRQLELETEPVSVNVSSLPEKPDANYIGAVGTFRIDRDIKTADATVGESIEIETTISGTGNITLISKPEYNFPDGLEVYQPQENSSINRKNQQISGNKTYTDVVIARKPGSFTIPETTLAYFNPNANKYITETLPAKTFSVAPNPNAVAGRDQPGTLSVQPVTGLANWVTQQENVLWGYWWFWAGLITPMVALAVAYWQKTYHEKMNTDRNFARSKKATTLAKERLEQALEHSKNGHIKEAYNALQKALTGFIGDRLGLPEAGLSIEQYVAALEEQQVNGDLVKNVRMLLNKCATINYAPNASHDYLKSHVGLAQSIIEKLKKEL